MHVIVSLPLNYNLGKSYYHFCQGYVSSNLRLELLLMKMWVLWNCVSATGDPMYLPPLMLISEILVIVSIIITMMC